MKAMTMLFFLRVWGLRSRPSAVNSDVDDLVLLYGANAYEEARRRRAQASDLTDARHWSAVKSEIGRRILEVCADPANLDRLNSRLIDADEFGCAIWDPPAEPPRPAAETGTARGERRCEARLTAHRPVGARPRHMPGGRRRMESFPSRNGRIPAQDVCCDA